MLFPVPFLSRSHLRSLQLHYSGKHPGLCYGLREFKHDEVFKHRYEIRITESYGNVHFKTVENKLKVK